MLKKKNAFFSAYDQFHIPTVAHYSEEKINDLLQDSGIIRNKLKVNAAVYNAGVILSLQKEFGSFKNWLDHHHPLKKEEWVKLFKKTFRFFGAHIFRFKISFEICFGIRGNILVKGYPAPVLPFPRTSILQRVGKIIILLIIIP